MIEYFLVITLLMTIPFSAMVLFVGLGVQGAHLPVRRLLPYASALGIALSLFRTLPIPFGLHALFYLLLVIWAIRRLSHGSWAMVILGAMLTSVIAAVGEGLVGVPVMALLNVPMDEALRSPWLSVVAGWLGNSLIGLLALYFALRRPRESQE